MYFGIRNLGEQELAIDSIEPLTERTLHLYFKVIGSRFVVFRQRNENSMDHVLVATPEHILLNRLRQFFGIYGNDRNYGLSITVPTGPEQLW